jgi:tetratricopeptide (TPR) repeat protein
VKIVKWFLIGSVCLFCSATLARGDAAADLYNQGAAALDKNQYADAAKAFDTLITSYPTTPLIDDARLRSGLAYLYAGKFPEAVDHLAKEVAPDAKPQYRGPALYFTALAQFSQGQKSNDKAAFAKAITTLTTLIDVVTKTPTPETKNYLESGVYYRALSEYELEKYDDAEKDLIQLTTSPQFSASLTKPDYYVRLGGIYAQEANLAVGAKTPDTTAITALAQKALDAFDQVSRDPNALVQANDANMSKAQVLFMIAQLDASGAGYQKALDAYRLVRRKADMIPIQQDRVNQLQKKAQAQAQAQAQAGSLAGLSSDISMLITREQNRLKDLKSDDTPDPIIQALIGIAECYVAMKQPDEARTILHRLVAHAKLTPDQQQTVDFQTLYSYVLGGQTDAADKALTDYLGKHAGDPNADFISYSIATDLAKRKDYAGALKQTQRSLQDFNKGKYAANALGLEAEMLNKLGRQAEADKVIDDFVKANPGSSVASTMLLTKAQTDTTKGNLDAALADYKSVRDNTSLSPEIQAAAGAGYIQTLNTQQKYDLVISETKAYQAKYPTSKAMASVLLFAALALDQKHDPGAIAALQDIARKFPQEEASPFALSYVVTIYSKMPNSGPQMIQAANDLQKAYPEAYPFLEQAADTVSAVLIKQKKFDEAAALFKPLAAAPKPDIAAAAQNKIGDVWLSSAKTIHYQSLPVEQRPEADKRIVAAEQAYLATLKNSPGELAAVGDAFDGLVNTGKVRRSWGLLKDADFEGYFDKSGADLTSDDMKARIELAKAGLVFIVKDGAKQFPAALDRFKKVIAANPSLHLTRQETDQFGDLLLAAKDFSTAEKVYGDFLQSAPATDRVAQGDAYYGLGATALGQGNLAQAKDYFLKLKALPGGGLWHPHISEANYGVALADEQSSVAADGQAALQTYAQLMQNPAAGVILQAKAMLGYGRLLEKAGHGVKSATADPTENAVHYYTEPQTLFGPASPEQSAEGLYAAAQVYQKAGDAANAKKMNDLLKTYTATAPDWAAKAQ